MGQEEATERCAHGQRVQGEVVMDSPLLRILPSVHSSIRETSINISQVLGQALKLERERLHAKEAPGLKCSSKQRWY